MPLIATIRVSPIDSQARRRRTLFEQKFHCSRCMSWHSGQRLVRPEPKKNVSKQYQLSQITRVNSSRTKYDSAHYICQNFCRIGTLHSSEAESMSAFIKRSFQNIPHGKEVCSGSKFLGNTAFVVQRRTGCESPNSRFCLNLQLESPVTMKHRRSLCLHIFRSMTPRRYRDPYVSSKQHLCFKHNQSDIFLCLRKQICYEIFLSVKI
jgi:hypothetical protein